MKYILFISSLIFLNCSHATTTNLKCTVSGDKYEWRTTAQATIKELVNKQIYLTVIEENMNLRFIIEGDRELNTEVDTQTANRKDTINKSNTNMYDVKLNYESESMGHDMRIRINRVTGNIVLRYGLTANDKSSFLITEVSGQCQIFENKNRF